MKPSNVDDDSLPPERAAAQRERESELLGLLGTNKAPGFLKPDRALAAKLSPSEMKTLVRIARATSAPDSLNNDHVARLVSLRLVSMEDRNLVLTILGKQRIAQGR